MKYYKSKSRQYYSQKHNIRGRAYLHDWYIRTRLRRTGFKSAEITPELIAVKRAQLQLKRNIRAERKKTTSHTLQDFSELSLFLQSSTTKNVPK
jgi:hypothetical protein